MAEENNVQTRGPSDILLVEDTESSAYATQLLNKLP